MNVRLYVFNLLACVLLVSLSMALGCERRETSSRETPVVTRARSMQYTIVPEQLDAAQAPGAPDASTSDTPAADAADTPSGLSEQPSR